MLLSRDLALSSVHSRTCWLSGCRSRRSHALCLGLRVWKVSLVLVVSGRQLRFSSSPGKMRPLAHATFASDHAGFRLQKSLMPILPLMLLKTLGHLPTSLAMPSLCPDNRIAPYSPDRQAPLGCRMQVLLLRRQCFSDVDGNLF